MLHRITLAIFIAAIVPAQEPQPDFTTRQMWDATLLEKRKPPAPAKPTTKPAAAPAKPPATLTKGTLVGVTVWSLRPSKPSDTREIRSLVHEGDADEELSPERVPADQPLSEGQKLRIGIEVAQEGYLYIIDRDEYADGTKSVPYLIFPTRRILGGNNKVSPGMLVELPSANDNPSYFKMVRSKPNQTQELLTILISPQPIPGLTLTGGRQKVDEDQLAVWEKQWKVKSYQLGDAAQKGKTYTLAEKQAASGAKPLGQDDPLPQMMYQLDSKAGDTLMLDLPLRIGK